LAFTISFEIVLVSFAHQNRFYYCALKERLQNHKILIRNPFLNTTNSDQKFPVVCFNIDDELVYWNFFLDFGPLNLGQLHRFTTRLNKLLANARRDNMTVLFYSSTVNNKRANAIFLLCAWQILELNRTPEQAFRGFTIEGYHKNDGFLNSNGNQSNNTNKHQRSMTSSNPPLLPLTSIARQTIAPLPPFHDASPYRCTYELTLMDCLGALVKARQFDFFDWGEKFDVNEYEHFEQVEVRLTRYIGVEYMYRLSER
jgi:cell division cycle 14